MARLLTPDSNKVVLVLLSEGPGQEIKRGLKKTAEIIVSRSRTFDEDFEQAVRILRELKKGITEKPK